MFGLRLVGGGIAAVAGLRDEYRETVEQAWVSCDGAKDQGAGTQGKSNPLLLLNTISTWVLCCVKILLLANIISLSQVNRFAEGWRKCEEIETILKSREASSSENVSMGALYFLPYFLKLHIRIWLPEPVPLILCSNTPVSLRNPSVEMSLTASTCLLKSLSSPKLYSK